MHCFFCTIKSGERILKEHKAAKWLSLHELDTINWLPADIAVVEKLKSMEKNIRPDRIEAAKTAQTG